MILRRQVWSHYPSVSNHPVVYRDPQGPAGLTVSGASLLSWIATLHPLDSTNCTSLWNTLALLTLQQLPWVSAVSHILWGAFLGHHPVSTGLLIPSSSVCNYTFTIWSKLHCHQTRTSVETKILSFSFSLAYPQHLLQCLAFRNLYHGLLQYWYGPGKQA